MSDSLRYQDAIKNVRLTASGTAIHRAGRAFLDSVIINDPPAAPARLRIYDGPTIAGDVVADMDLIGFTFQNTIKYGVVLQSGLTVEMTDEADVTVTYE